MLRRLGWSSVPSSSFSEARLGEIIAPSRRNNTQHHISGMLLFTGAQFLSILEGDQQDLEKLWRCLEVDVRHTDLVRIGDERCGHRWFPGWMMAYGEDKNVDTRIDALRAVPRSSQWAKTIRPIMMSADSMSSGSGSPAQRGRQRRQCARRETPVAHRARGTAHEFRSRHDPSLHSGGRRRRAAPRINPRGSHMGALC